MKAMKKVFCNAQLDVLYFDEVDIITTSEYATESGTSTESSTAPETVFVPGDGFNGEGIPF